jgi:hypothetical protein
MAIMTAMAKHMARADVGPEPYRDPFQLTPIGALDNHRPPPKSIGRGPAVSTLPTAAKKKIKRKWYLEGP